MTPKHSMRMIVLMFLLTAFTVAACVPVDKEVNACNYPNGCESKPWGDVNGYGTKEVGLCSYLGGCLPDSE